MTLSTLQATQVVSDTLSPVRRPEIQRQEALAALTEVERHVLDTLSGIRFGTLEITVHDARVVQVEKSEKIRFDPKGKLVSDRLS